MQTLVAWTGALLAAAAVIATLAGLVSAFAELRRGRGVRWRDDNGQEETCWRRLCAALHPFWKLALAYLVVLLLCATLYRIWAAKLAPKPDFWDCLYFSTATMTLTNFGEFKATGPARFVAHVETAGGIILLALLIAKVVTGRTVRAVEAAGARFRLAESLEETTQLNAAISRLSSLRSGSTGVKGERRVDRSLYAIGACLNRKLKHIRSARAVEELGYAACRADVQSMQLYIDTMAMILGDAAGSCLSGDTAQQRILLDLHAICQDIAKEIRTGCLEPLPSDSLLRHTLERELAALDHGLDACNQTGYLPAGH